MARKPGSGGARLRNGAEMMHSPDLPEGYNTQKIAFLMQIMPEEPLDYDDVDEMRRRFRRYLELCKAHDVKIGNMSAYTAIGIDGKIADDWDNNPRANPERTGFIKKVKRICASYREILMNDGQIRDAVGIFWQKNYDGMKDVHESVNYNVDPLADSARLSQLQARYVGDVTPPLIEVESKDATE